MKKKLFFLFAAIWVGPASAAPDFSAWEKIHIHPDLQYKNLAAKTYVFHAKTDEVDSQNILSRENLAKFQKLNSPALEFDNTESPSWILFITNNDAKVDFEWALQFAFPQIETLILYELTENKLHILKEDGDTFVFSNRDFQRNDYVFKMKARAGLEQVYLVKIQTNGIFSFELLYRKSADILNEIISDNFQDGLFFGFIFLLSLISFVVYLAVREKVYLLYSIWLMTISMALIVLKGYAFAYIWPNFPRLSHVLLLPLISLASLVGVVFLREFTEKNKIKWIFNIHLVLSVLILLLSAFTFLSFGIRLLLIGTLSAFSLFTMSLVGVMNYMKRERSAKYILIGNTFLLLGALIFGLRLFFILENASFSFLIFQLGVLLNAIFMLMALQYKLKRINIKLHDYQDDLEYYSTIFESMNESFIVLNSDLSVRFANNETCIMLGYTKEEIIRLNFREIISTDGFLFDDNEIIFSQLEHINQAELHYRDKNGKLITVLFSGSAIKTSDGRSTESIVCIALNLNDLKIAHERASEAEKNVIHQKKYFEQVLNKVHSEIFVVNSKFEYEFINPAIITDPKIRADIIGKTDYELCQILQLDFSIASFRIENLKKAKETKKSIFFEEKIENHNYEKTFYLRSLNPILGPNGEVEKIIGHSINITKRKLMELQLEQQANTDDLTGIPNRFYFLKKINEIFEAFRKKYAGPFAIFFLDVDRFKIINDSLGHIIGDKLLIAIARRLQKNLDHDVVIARYGGDEFTVLLRNYESIENVVEIASTIHRSLSETYLIDSNEIITSSSIGIALANVRYENPSQIIRDADLALYHAKSKGRARYQIFNEEMHKQTVAIQRLESNLRKATDRGEFSLRFQPLVELKSGRIKSFEALLRWRNKELGDISPIKFIPLAEETGLIYRIGNWVMREAFRNARRWHKIGFGDVGIAVNLSARQFQNVNFIGDLHELLRDTNINANNIEFELTEGIIMGEDEVTLAILRELSDQNMKIAIDDFGTGYSSFAYLKRFKIDTIKIDQSFVKDILNSDNSRALFLSMIAMAKSLGLKVTAEGVETQDQFDFIKTTDCDYIQGNFLSLPVTTKEATRLLRKKIIFK